MAEIQVHYQISKEFHFSASHKLEDLPDDHQCARLHGHNYILKVTLSGWDLNEVGFVLDYGELGFVKDAVEQLDHQHLNDIFNFNPTSENICAYYAKLFARYIKLEARWYRIRTISVSLSETPKTWAHALVHVDDFR